MATLEQSAPRSGSGLGRALRWLLALLVALVLAALLSVAAGIGLYQYVYQDRIFMGVHAAGVDLGGLTRAEAAEMVRQRVDYFDRARIQVKFNAKTWEASPARLGGSLPVTTIVDDAFTYGRSGPLLDRLQAQLDLYRARAEVPLRSQFTPQAAQEFVRAIASEIDRPARNASLTIANGKVETTPGQEGWEVDQATVVQAIEDRILRMADEPITVAYVKAQPAITDVSAVKAQTERIIGAPVTLTFQDKQWTLSPAQIADMVVFYQEAGPDGKPTIVPRVRQDMLTPWVDALPAQVNRDPQDAAIHWNGQRVVATRASVVGYQMDVAETLKRVNTALVSTERTIPAVVLERKPSIDSNNLDALGIKELVVRGQTQFKGSPPERIHNIQVAANKFNDVLVPPGEVFSFAEHLGNVTAAEGYVEALVIVGNKTEQDYGGGVCQVSSTVFRAAFFGGFPIVERYAHAYRVSYYEEGVGPGLDATVFTPQVDFKFRNDTPNWLLIRTEMDAKNQALSFLFYGTKPDRQVTMEGPRILSETPAKPAVYQRDPTLKPGQVKQVDWAHPGADVVVSRVVKNAGQPDRRDTFRSVYQPWQDVFLVGAGDPRGN